MAQVVWVASNVAVIVGVVSFTYSIAVTALYLLGGVSIEFIPTAMTGCFLYVAFRGLGRIMYERYDVVRVSIVRVCRAFWGAVNVRAIVLLTVQAVVLIHGTSSS